MAFVVVFVPFVLQNGELEGFNAKLIVLMLGTNNINRNRFLAPDATLPADIMPDGLHPNRQGYRIWADAIAGRVRELTQ